MTTLICESERVTLIPGTAAVVAPLDLVENIAAPAIVHSSGETAWLVILVRAATEADRSRVAALADRRIGYLESGHSIDLPPTRYPDGPLTWHNDSGDRPFPPFAAVADALLAVAP